MKIICIGRNYAEHIKELQNETPDEPVLFLKPDTALLNNRLPFFIPDWSSDIHFECELVLRICRVGKNIEKRFAHRYYDKISVGIDFTARDVQQKLKAKGLPWEKAKAFDGAAAVGEFLPIEMFDKKFPIPFSLIKNGKTVQQSDTSFMLNNFDTIIEEASRYFTLKKGDFIFTGTPAGVGKVEANDLLEAYIQEQKLLTVKVK